MALTGQQYLDLLSDRIVSIRRRLEELDSVWVRMVQDTNVYAEQHSMPTKDSTASSLRAWYNFDAHWGPILYPYYQRIRAATQEAQAAVNRAEEISVITPAQIEAANTLITDANRRISQGRTSYQYFQNSQMGRIIRDSHPELSLTLLVGVGWSTVITQRAEDTVQSIEAASEAVGRAGRAALGSPAWLQYAFALTAFTGAGYLWFKYLR